MRAVRFSALQCIAVRCIASQCVAASVCVNESTFRVLCCNLLQRVAPCYLCCNMLQCVVVCCSVLQHQHVQKRADYVSINAWKKS